MAEGPLRQVAHEPRRRPDRLLVHDGSSPFHEAAVCGLIRERPTITKWAAGPRAARCGARPRRSRTAASGSITIGVSGDARDQATVFQLVNERMRDAAVAMQLFSGDLILIGSDETDYSSWLDEIGRIRTTLRSFPRWASR